MSEEQIIDKVSMIDQWKVSGDSYTQGELDAIGQLLELYYDNKKQLEQEKEKNKELEKSDRSKEQSSMSYYNKLRDLKNKIIAKLEELEYGDGYFTFLEERDLELTIKILKQLLEEK